MVLVLGVLGMNEGVVVLVVVDVKVFLVVSVGSCWEGMSKSPDI